MPENRARDSFIGAAIGNVLVFLGFPFVFWLAKAEVQGISTIDLVLGWVKICVCVIIVEIIIVGIAMAMGMQGSDFNPGRNHM